MLPLLLFTFFLVAGTSPSATAALCAACIKSEGRLLVGCVAWVCSGVGAHFVVVCVDVVDTGEVVVLEFEVIIIFVVISNDVLIG
jgi:hypothetical protein